MTAVIYARYSSDNQREESIEGQIRECTAYAEKNGITIVKHYIDRAISAKTDNRPEFQQMIKDSDKKLFDIVLVWKLDRFARNRYDSARYKTQLKKNGVKLMSATEIISEGPEGIILESVLEGYAEYYSADLAEKVVRGQTENILKGRCNGGRGTFGYTLDSERKFHIDPLTSPFVLESFKKYNEGSTMKEIRDWLNENGIKNPVGGAFTYNSVEHMLKNRRYIGELKFRDVVVPEAIPPIIPLELFEDVQEKIAKNKKAPARRKAEDDYLLTTKLFCGYCGALMFGESGTSRTGEVHRYYKCATAKKHKGCKKKTVRKQWLEDLVVNQTMQLVKDDAAMESIIAKVMELQNKENTNIPLYEKQLRDAESGIQNMLNAIQAGILTSSTKERLQQPEPNEFFGHFRLRQLFFRNACFKLTLGFFQLLQPLLGGAGQDTGLNRIEHILDTRFSIPKLFLIEGNVGVLLVLQFHHLGDDRFHGGIVFDKLHRLVDHQIFQPLFTDGLFLAALVLFGSSTFIVAVNFTRPACAALAKHQRPTVAAEQLGGEQIIVLCLSTGRGFLVFCDLLLHILKQFQWNDGRDSIRHDHIPEFQFSDVPPVFEHMFDTVISERTAHRVLDAVFVQPVPDLLHGGAFIVLLERFHSQMPWGV